jgi:hypothetical protein
VPDICRRVERRLKPAWPQVADGTGSGNCIDNRRASDISVGG